MEYAKTSRGSVLTHDDDREGFYIKESVEYRYHTHKRVRHGVMPTGAEPVVLVQFKNKRTGYYLNAQMLPLQEGELVTVATAPGHDVGVVAITGWYAHREYMKIRSENSWPLLEIYRYSTKNDIDKWVSSIAQEQDTLVVARAYARDLGLAIKVFDVEYQGDGNKFTVYYSSDKRIDFRELVRQLAERFGVRVQMQQFGVRQEPARIGGLGTCGQEVCCSRWMKHTPPVLAAAIKMQELQVQTCSGQCGKLKCCLNFELDAYYEARSKMPRVNAPLELEGYNLHYVKSDPFREHMFFSTMTKSTMNLIMLTVDEVRSIMAQNARGEVAQALEKLRTVEEDSTANSARVESIIESDSITRFDTPKSKGKKKRRRKSAASSPRGSGGSATPDASSVDTRQGSNTSPRRKHLQPRSAQDGKKGAGEAPAEAGDGGSRRRGPGGRRGNRQTDSQSGQNPPNGIDSDRAGGEVAGDKKAAAPRNDQSGGNRRQKRPNRNVRNPKRGNESMRNRPSPTPPSQPNTPDEIR